MHLNASCLMHSAFWEAQAWTTVDSCIDYRLSSYIHGLSWIQALPLVPKSRLGLLHSRWRRWTTLRRMLVRWTAMDSELGTRTGTTTRTGTRPETRKRATCKKKAHIKTSALKLTGSWFPDAWLYSKYASDLFEIHCVCIRKTMHCACLQLLPQQSLIYMFHVFILRESYVVMLV